MANIDVEFFGGLSDRLGKSVAIELPSGNMTIAQLRTQLANQHDYEEILKPSIRALINDEFVRERSLVNSGDIVSFISPLSGG